MRIQPPLSLQYSQKIVSRLETIYYGSRYCDLLSLILYAFPLEQRIQMLRRQPRQSEQRLLQSSPLILWAGEILTGTLALGDVVENLVELEV